MKINKINEIKAIVTKALDYCKSNKGDFYLSMALIDLDTYEIMDASAGLEINTADSAVDISNIIIIGMQKFIEESKKYMLRIAVVDSVTYEIGYTTDTNNEDCLIDSTDYIDNIYGEKNQLKIKNINSKWGDEVIFDSVEEMENDIIDCGYGLPDGGLIEGKDYEFVNDDDDDCDDDCDDNTVMVFDSETGEVEYIKDEDDELNLDEFIDTSNDATKKEEETKDAIIERAIAVRLVDIINEAEEAANSYKVDLISRNRLSSFNKEAFKLGWIESSLKELAKTLSVRNAFIAKINNKVIR